jgi:hypothetical protein
LALAPSRLPPRAAHSLLQCLSPLLPSLLLSSSLLYAHLLGSQACRVNETESPGGVARGRTGRDRDSTETGAGRSAWCWRCRARC